MTLVLPGEPGYVEAARGLPRQFRDPVPIPSEAPSRAPGTGGTYGADVWPWLIDPATGWPARDSGVPVTEATLCGIPAAWYCLNFIANACASCAPPIEFDSGGVRADPLSPVVDRPWAFLSAHEFWFMAFVSALVYGNFVGMNIDVDPLTGYPRQVMPVHPADVLLTLVDGMPVYWWAGEAWGWDEVTHVRGFTSPGSLWGLGVIEAQRLALTGTLSLAAYGAGTFASAAENSVTIQVDRPELSEAQATAIQQAWIERHGSGIRRPAVIPRSMTVTPLSFSPADAQFLESRQLGIAEVALMFGLAPTDLDASIGGGSNLTYANREQREVERLTHGIGPWLRRFEQVWADLLPGRRNIAFNVERLLRADTLTRTQATNMNLANGTFTLNDARGVERLPLYPHAWADVPFGRPPPEAVTDPTAPAGDGTPAPTGTSSTAEAV
jgi:HK97 family phage portal protein